MMTEYDFLELLNKYNKREVGSEETEYEDKLVVSEINGMTLAYSRNFPELKAYGTDEEEALENLLALYDDLLELHGKD